VLNGPDGWQVLSWPSGHGLQAGEGLALPEPNGPRIAVLRTDGTIMVQGTIVAEADERHRNGVGWAGPTLVWTRKRPDVRPPFMPGGSLLPVPTTGPTAQRYGSYRDEGMELWQGTPGGGQAKRVACVSGIEVIRHPMALPWGEIAFTRYRYPVYGSPSTERLATIRNGTLEDLFPDIPGSFAGLAPSPDGCTLAVLHSALEPAFPFWWRLALVRDGRLRYPLPEALRLTGTAPVWAPDGRHLAVTAFDGIRVGIVVVESSTGEWQWLGPVDGCYDSVALAPGGHEALAVWQSLNAPAHLCLVSVHGRSAWGELAPTTPMAGPCQLVTWRNGGAVLEGILTVPSGSGPWPLVVDLHGGPVNGLRARSHAGLSQWRKAGFAAFAPDYRGSGILGQEEMLAAAREARPSNDDASSIGDVLSGVASLVARGVADPNRLFLFGHSYGGYLVNQLVTHDHRFQAAVCWEGHADARLAFLYGWGGGGLHSARHLFGGNPWQEPAQYRKASPLASVAHVRTPLLILWGDHDLSQPIAWYTALREHGVETDLIIYRGEGHSPQNRANVQDVYERSAAWFRAHLGHPAS
jgi:dipeptidyl aminopeptidase/acylaminoacyl peptidase